jgi:hypothetical protein
MPRLSGIVPSELELAKPPLLKKRPLSYGIAKVEIDVSLFRRPCEERVVTDTYP